MSSSSCTDVLRVRDLAPDVLKRFAAGVGVAVAEVEPQEPIPSTFWGEPEAGVAGTEVWVREDTPLHSLLHEVSHVLCARAAGREAFVRDAGGDDIEECAVCYLQVILANVLSPMTRSRMWADMDRWGYSFREGSARAWFFGDGCDGRDWLLDKGLIALGEDQGAETSQSFVGFGASP